MNEKSKRNLKLSVIAIALMLGAFAFLLIEIKTSNNKYSTEKKISNDAQKEAQISVLLTDLKKDIDKSFLSTQKTTFNLNGKNVFGWKVVFTEMTPELTDKVTKFFENSKFLLNTSIEYGIVQYDKGNLSCQINKETEIKVIVYCGYPE